ncbi:phage tail tape measure protein [Microbacterium sp. SA39]|uniref:phage tail tape measure protein n=1 Tax=Microbacterium sp. SA39 TaxID=1263625 RepID=UPI00061FDCD1|nr:phage tail tape measure protein [Microbacterium sp. SA39]KJQ54659.1 Phage-related minor tail protein [Microbacterium sp. SA39]
MAKLTVADLEVLFSANVDKVEKAEKQIVAIGKKIESKPLTLDADAKGVLGSIERVEARAKKLVSERAVLKLDADVSRAEKNLGRAIDRLEDLHVRAEGGIDVTADVRRAEASIQRFERQLEGLKQARNVVDVDVDPEPAESNLKRFLSLFRKKTEEAGSEGGRSLGQGLDAATRGAGQKVGDVVGGDIESTLVDALSAIPIAGGIILAGVAIGKAITGAIQDGLAVEKNTDRLQGLTGITEAEALRLGRASGEAYANNFGDSIESNMDATRLALQFRILDPSATTRDAQLVVQGLAGIADVLGEDVEPVARTVAQLLRTGLAASAKDAFDILATGAREGVNIGGDLLDTFDEYSTQFRKLGLDGPQALGLISQGLRAGARDSDVAADALKEFAIRAIDPAMKQGFEEVGFSWDDLSRRIAEGGPTAAAALDETLDRIREMPDPAQQAAAAMALFGTQSEDMAAALLSMDLSTAVEQLDGVQGAAQRMFDTLADNDASKIEQAGRNIEVAADGIKGALAAAFGEPLENLATWVSQNRGPLTQFLLDLANGALDFGASMVTSAADATEAIGTFIAGPMADLVGWLGSISNSEELKTLADDMRDFDETTATAADTMRTDWLGSIEQARGELNKWGEPVVMLGYANDAALRTAESVAKVGIAADGTAFSLTSFDTANLGATASGRALQEQLDASAAALAAEYEAAIAAGDSQANLQDRYTATRDALMGQLTALGLNTEQAQALIDTVLQTPEEASTTYTSNADTETGKVIDLGNRIITLPDGSTVIYADTSPARGMIDSLITTSNGKQIKIKVFADGSGFKLPGGRTVTAQANGGVVEFMANGGLTPMSSLAQMVPQNTWRVVGDRSDVPELFAPLDGSARSWALLMEGFARMPGSPPQMMANGAVTGGGALGDMATLINEIRALRGSLSRPNVSLSGNIEREWLSAMRELRDDEGTEGIG